MKVRLLIHRWFAQGGAGWAYHPELRPHLMGCRKALTNHLNGPPGPVGPLEAPDEGLVLVGLRRPDPDRATDDFGRPIVVLCAAAVPGRPKEVGLEELHHLLAGVCIPNDPKTDAGLELDWFGEPTLLSPLVKPSLPPVERSSGIAWVAALALLGIAGLAVVLFLLDFGTPIASTIPLTPATTGSAATELEAPPGPDLITLESQLLRDVTEANLESLKEMLSKPELFRPFPPEPRARLSEAMRNRCHFHYERYQPDRNLAADETEVKRRIDRLATLREMISAAHVVFLKEQAPGEETQGWGHFQQLVDRGIDRFRYERVQLCRQELNAALQDGKSAWRDKFRELQASLDLFPEPQRDTPEEIKHRLEELQHWCDRVRGRTVYDFVLLNVPGEWILSKTSKGKTPPAGDEKPAGFTRRRNPNDDWTYQFRCELRARG